MANKQPKMYILDTSVAGLMLDGELWSREPGLLVRYHKDLQTTLLHPDSKVTLSDLEGSSSTVQRSVHAWKWTQSIIQTQKNTGTKLLVTPTVQNELTDALQVCTCMYICSIGFGVDSLFSPQFRENAWKCCEEVGIEELYDLCYHVSPSDVNNVVSTVESELMAAVAPRHLTPMEKKAVLPAINAFANQATMARLAEDIKIYIEACIASQKLRGNVVMLVTDDHKFFRVCARSVIAENILMEQVQTLVREARPRDRNGVEDTHPPIRVKLAGEIIPGV